MLIEKPFPEVADEVVSAFAIHLRLPEGFGASAERNGALRRTLAAATQAVEARAGRTLLRRRLVARIDAWDGEGGWSFPTAPVASVEALTLVEGDGRRAPVSRERLRLKPGEPPRFSFEGAAPRIPSGGWAELAFLAGYGAWSDGPPDLRQAAFLLAANLYEDPLGRAESWTPGVKALLAPYRRARL